MHWWGSFKGRVEPRASSLHRLPTSWLIFYWEIIRVQASFCVQETVMMTTFHFFTLFFFSSMIRNERDIFGRWLQCLNVSPPPPPPFLLLYQPIWKEIRRAKLITFIINTSINFVEYFAFPLGLPNPIVKHFDQAFYLFLFSIQWNPMQGQSRQRGSPVLNKKISLVVKYIPIYWIITTV